MRLGEGDSPFFKYLGIPISRSDDRRNERIDFSMKMGLDFRKKIRNHFDFNITNVEKLVVVLWTSVQLFHSRSKMTKISAYGELHWQLTRAFNDFLL